MREHVVIVVLSSQGTHVCRLAGENPWLKHQTSNCPYHDSRWQWVDFRDLGVSFSMEQHNIQQRHGMMYGQIYSPLKELASWAFTSCCELWCTLDVLILHPNLKIHWWQGVHVHDMTIAQHPYLIRLGVGTTIAIQLWSINVYQQSFSGAEHAGGRAVITISLLELSLSAVYGD